MQARVPCIETRDVSLRGGDGGYGDPRVQTEVVAYAARIL